MFSLCFSNTCGGSTMNWDGLNLWKTRGVQKGVPNRLISVDL